MYKFVVIFQLLLLSTIIHARQKKRGDEMQDKKNGDTRRETEKNGRQDVRQKKWGEEMPDRKKMGRQDARQKKWRDKM